MRKSRGGSTGQTWSIDLIIAVVIFVLIITIFYALLSRPDSSTEEALSDEAKYISTRVLKETGSQNPCAFLDRSKIDRTKLQECFQHQNIDVFREQNAVEQGFCIYIEDQNGRIISVNNMTGFGDSDLNVSGVPCGQTYSG